jgi:catechol 2,3-dioxygenase-like lactoylglutathione lyase family enzyme
MIDHISSYATDFTATKAFYQAALAALGYGMQREMTIDADPDLPGRRAAAFGPPGKTTFWVIEVLEAASPRHIAFAAADRGAVDRFHRAGLSAGGSDLGPPGVRAIYHADYYGAFLADPDGNNAEAVCHAPA